MDETQPSRHSQHTTAHAREVAPEKQPVTAATHHSRRTVVRAAAWSLPVVALAATAPAASASVTTSRVYWTADRTQLLELELLSGGTLVGLQLFPSAPTAFAIDNGPGIIPNVTMEVSVRKIGGLDLGLGVGARYLRGFAPTQVPGAIRAADPVITERRIGGIGVLVTAVYAQDTFTTFTLGDVESSRISSYAPLTWGATDRKTVGLVLAEIGVATSYSVVCVFKSEGVEFARLESSVDIPVNAGIL